MVQVHVPAREWGFDSPLGHHLPLRSMDEREAPDEVRIGIWENLRWALVMILVVIVVSQLARPLLALLGVESAG